MTGSLLKWGIVGILGWGLGGDPVSLRKSGPNLPPPPPLPAEAPVSLQAQVRRIVATLPSPERVTAALEAQARHPTRRAS